MRGLVHASEFQQLKGSFLRFRKAVQLTFYVVVDGDDRVDDHVGDLEPVDDLDGVDGRDTGLDDDDAGVALPGVGGQRLSPSPLDVGSNIWELPLPNRSPWRPCRRSCWRGRCRCRRSCRR